MNDFSHYLLVTAHACVCVFGIFICACRSSAMDRTTTKMSVRAHYALIGAGLAGMSVAPVSAANFMAACCMVAAISAGFGAWKNGQPSWARKPGFRGVRN